MLPHESIHSPKSPSGAVHATGTSSRWLASGREGGLPLTLSPPHVLAAACHSGGQMTGNGRNEHDQSGGVGEKRGPLP